MTLIKGKPLADKMKQEVAEELKKIGKPAKLTVILVGDDPASQTYVNNKAKDCGEVGIESEVIRFDASITEDRLLAEIDRLNKDANVNGLLVQMPLPKHINETNIIEAISPYKDVDCFHPYNVGRLFTGNTIVEPCTPSGIIRLLEFYGVKIESKNAVVLGRSNIVGKPTALLLMYKNASISVCHSKTHDLNCYTKTADIIITAVGKPGLLKADMVKDGVVVIDVGMNRIEDKTSPKGFRFVGDVDFDSVSQKASAITPVPGGVGLITRAVLLSNTIKCAKLQYADK